MPGTPRAACDTPPVGSTLSPRRPSLVGAIAGDVVGSIHERSGTKTKAFPLLTERSHFTDDTVMTLAIAEGILSGRPFGEVAHEIGRRHPHAGWGGAFRKWLASDDPRPYGSWGNGSAMRVTAIGIAFDDEREVLQKAAESAAFSHDHPDAIAGAQAAALAVFLARTTHDAATIRREIAQRFGYDLERTVDSIRPTYTFDVSCRGSVPEAIVAFLDAADWEDAVRNAISLGGDADTLACIAGGIAEAFHGPPPAEVEGAVRGRLTPDLAEILERFEARFGGS